MLQKFSLCLVLTPLPLLVGISLFYSCTNIPEHDLASKTSSACCSSIVTDAFSTGQFVEGQWPNTAWWEAYNDPQLNELIETTLASSPTLKSAEQRLKMAVEAAKAQKGYLYPEIDLSFGDNWQHFGKNSFFRSLAPIVPPVINQIDLDLNFTYEFDFWGKNRALYEAALGESLAMQAELAQSTLILTTSIVYAYFQHQVTAIKLKFLRKIEQNHEQLLGLAKARFSYAIDNALQEAAVLQNYLEAKKAVVAAEEDLLLLQEQIKALSGIGQDGELLISSSDISIDRISEDRLTLPPNLCLDLLARRPDLEAQRWLVEKSAQEIHVAKTAFYPNINLMAFVGLESLKFNTFFQKQSAMSSLNPAIHLPIFTAGRLRAQLMGKVAEFSQAVETYNALVLQAAEEVAMQLTKIVKIQEQANLQRKIVETTIHNTQLVIQRFQYALDPLFDVLMRSNEQFQEQINLAELDYGRRLASILLIRALGGGYEYD